MANKLAQLLGLNNPNMMPSPERSQLIQALQAQSMRPATSQSPIESLNIASKPLLAALLSKRERQADENVSGRQQAALGALMRAENEQLDPTRRQAARQAMQTILAGLPSNNPVSNAIAEGQISQIYPKLYQTIGSSVVGRTFEGQNGNMWYLNRQTGQPEDTGIPFAVGIRYLEGPGGGFTPAPTKNVQSPTTEAPDLQTADEAIDEGARATTAGKAAEAGIERAGELRSEATDAFGSLQTIREARSLIDEGIRSGTAAGVRNSIAKALDTLLGRPTDEQQLIANTETYVANAGSLVGQVIKQFGAGTGLSDADREYANRLAGGQIELNENALKEILRIQAEISFHKVNRYNSALGRISKEDVERGLFDPVEFVPPYEGFVIPGTEQDGYRYKGGGPQRQSSWEKID